MRGLLSNQQAMSACLSSELLSPRLCRGFFHASSSTQKKERPLAGLATASPLLTLTHSRGVLGSVDPIYSRSLTTSVGYRTLRSNCFLQRNSAFGSFITNYLERLISELSPPIDQSATVALRVRNATTSPNSTQPSG